MKKILNVFLAVALVSLGVMTVQFLTVNGAYTNAECGVQKWETKILFWDFGEPPIDEYGIGSRWSCAHKRACGDSWEKGALGAFESEYWPALHLYAAKGAEISEIRGQIAGLSKQVIFSKDKLGRTIFHWLAVHQDRVKADILMNDILGLHDIDSLSDIEGMLPEDWASNCNE